MDTNDITDFTNSQIAAAKARIKDLNDTSQHIIKKNQQRHISVLSQISLLCRRNFKDLIRSPQVIIANTFSTLFIAVLIVAFSVLKHW